MYLSKLVIKNFRSCYDTTVTFRESLTLLVGENSSGKSNVVAATQLVTLPLSGRPTRFFDASDVSFGQGGESIEISAEFSGLTDAQKGVYLAAIDLDTGVLHYGTKFCVDERGSRFSRPVTHAGPAAGHDPEPELRDKIRHVYLAPLRDAERELNSGDGRRLAQIIEYMFSNEEQKGFIEDAKELLLKIGSHNVPAKVAAQVQEHVTNLTRPVRAQNVGIHSADHDLRRLARSLRMRMAEEGYDLADLADSGLGYANLLFIATVILELHSARDVELTLFLVEEPEAHLHPQLQAVLLRYLLEQAEQSQGRDDTAGPAGRIQIICTTHSPNLASSVGVENVVVLRSVPQRISAAATGDAAEADSEQAVAVVERKRTVAIAIADLGVPTADMRKISRYLDVTKAALLFARRVMLVEGIAEALACPTFARKLVYSGDDNEHQRRRNDFNAVTVIGVDGIDFGPYVRLLLTPARDGYSILDKLVVITDGDPVPSDLKADIEESDPDATALVTDYGGEESVESNEGENEREESSGDEAGANRKAALEALAASIGAAHRLKVFASTYTFEADLLIHKDNHEVLKRAFLRQHPRSAKKWTTIVGSDNPAQEFYRRLRRKSDKLIRKGEFVLDIVAAVDDGASFVCPDYLAAAIREVITDDEAANAA